MSSDTTDIKASTTASVAPSAAALAASLEPMVEFASKIRFATGDPIRAYKKAESLLEYPRDGGEFKFNICKNAKLEAVLAKSTTHFAYGGRAEEYRSYEFRDAWKTLLEQDGRLSAEELKDAEAILEKQNELPLGALTKIATPAPFGRGGETVFDKNVRNALEINADRMPEELKNKLTSLVKGERNRWQTPKVCEWETFMKPHGKIWTYKLYKIHMYGPGGKFESHVDTLHAENHVATMIVCLPSPHKGGRLRVHHLGETVDIRFKGKSNDRWWHYCECAAFFTDCAHEVAEVTKGWRVVAQFDVYEEDQGQAEPSNAASSESETEDEVVVKDFMVDQGCIRPPKGVRSDLTLPALVDAIHSTLSTAPNRTLGFFMRHQYSLPSLELNKLKGVDRVIFDALEKEGLQVTVRGVLAHFHQSPDEWNQETESMITSQDITVVGMKDFDQSKCGNSSESSCTSDSEDSNEKDDRKRPAENVEVVDLVVDSHMAKAECLREPDQTGNEPGEGYLVYRSACMIVSKTNKTCRNAATTTCHSDSTNTNDADEAKTSTKTNDADDTQIASA